MRGQITSTRVTIPVIGFKPLVPTVLAYPITEDTPLKSLSEKPLKNSNKSKEVCSKKNVLYKLFFIDTTVFNPRTNHLSSSCPRDLV